MILTFGTMALIVIILFFYFFFMWGFRLVFVILVLNQISALLNKGKNLLGGFKKDDGSA